MRHLLSALGLLVGLAGALFFFAANGAMQQIVAGTLMLIGAVLFSTGALLDAMEAGRQQVAGIHEELLSIRRSLEKR